MGEYLTNLEAKAKEEVSALLAKENAAAKGFLKRPVPLWLVPVSIALGAILALFVQAL